MKSSRSVSALALGVGSAVALSATLPVAGAVVMADKAHHGIYAAAALSDTAVKWDKTIKLGHVKDGSGKIVNSATTAHYLGMAGDLVKEYADKDIVIGDITVDKADVATSIKPIADKDPKAPVYHVSFGLNEGGKDLVGWEVAQIDPEVGARSIKPVSSTALFEPDTTQALVSVSGVEEKAKVGDKVDTVVAIPLLADFSSVGNTSIYGAINAGDKTELSEVDIKDLNVADRNTVIGYLEALEGSWSNTLGVSTPGGDMPSVEPTEPGDTKDQIDPKDMSAGATVLKAFMSKGFSLDEIRGYLRVGPDTDVAVIIDKLNMHPNITAKLQKVVDEQENKNQVKGAILALLQAGELPLDALNDDKSEPSEDAKPSESADPKPSESKSEEAKPSESKSDEAKPSDDVKPTESAEPKPSEDPKPSKSAPAEGSVTGKEVVEKLKASGMEFDNARLLIGMPNLSEGQVADRLDQYPESKAALNKILDDNKGKSGDEIGTIITNAYLNGDLVFTTGGDGLTPAERISSALATPTKESEAGLDKSEPATTTKTQSTESGKPSETAEPTVEKTEAKDPEKTEEKSNEKDPDKKPEKTTEKTIERPFEPTRTTVTETTTVRTTTTTTSSSKKNEKSDLEEILETMQTVLISLQSAKSAQQAQGSKVTTTVTTTVNPDGSPHVPGGGNGMTNNSQGHGGFGGSGTGGGSTANGSRTGGSTGGSTGGGSSSNSSTGNADNAAEQEQEASVAGNLATTGSTVLKVLGGLAVLSVILGGALFARSRMNKDES